MNYYVEFGGGLGDIFFQMHRYGQYASLANLQPGDVATLAVVSHNPFAGELFAWHPNRHQFRVLDLGYWTGEEDLARRREWNLPPFHRRGFSDLPGGEETPQYYPSPSDGFALSQVMAWAKRIERPLVVVSPGAGESYKAFPEGVTEPIIHRLWDNGFLPVLVGRSFVRNDRQEYQPADNTLPGSNMIDLLTVPAVGWLVREAAGVVACHSAVNMLAWMERKTNLLLYGEKTRDAFIVPRTQWACGCDHSETVHGLWDNWQGYLETFMAEVEDSSQ